MIESVIQNVLEAEKRANEIKAQADDDAVKLVETATIKAQEIKKQSLLNAKNVRLEILAKANEKASAEYNDSISKAEKSALELENALNEKVLVEANELVRRVLNGSCWNV